MALNRKPWRNQDEFLKKIFDTLNTMGPSQLESIGDYADLAFDHKYQTITKNDFLSLLDYQFIDTMINHYVELEEYEKCDVLFKIKQKYGKDYEGKK
jgi:hypothetical protein